MTSIPFTLNSTTILHLSYLSPNSSPGPRLSQPGPVLPLALSHPILDTCFFPWPHPYFSPSGPPTTPLPLPVSENASTSLTASPSSIAQLHDALHIPVQKPGPSLRQAGSVPLDHKVPL